MPETDVTPPPNQGAPPRTTGENAGRRFLWTAACLVVVVAGLKAGSQILVPFVVAVFLTIVSLPLVRLLSRLRIPVVLGVTVTLAAEIGLLYGVASLVGGQIGGFQRKIPEYQEKLGAAVQWLRDGRKEGAARDGPGAEETPPDAPPTTPTSPGETGAEPVPGPRNVLDQLLDPGFLLRASAMTVLGVTSLLSDMALVLFTMALMLLEAAAFSGKFTRALGAHSASLERYQGVVGQVQQYLMIKTLVSLATGVCVYLWLRFLEVDFAAVWGLIAFLFNYIPTIGSILAGIVPVILALLDHGLGTSVSVLAGYAVVNVVLGNVVEPFFLGRRLGLSPLIVFLCMVFWGWVWGPLGMLLAVPLTMTVKIFLENTDDLRPVAIMMDSAPPPAAAPEAGGP